VVIQKERQLYIGTFTNPTILAINYKTSSYPATQSIGRSSHGSPKQFNGKNTSQKQ